MEVLFKSSINFGYTEMRLVTYIKTNATSDVERTTERPVIKLIIKYTFD